MRAQSQICQIRKAEFPCNFYYTVTVKSFNNEIVVLQEKYTQQKSHNSLFLLHTKGSNTSGECIFHVQCQKCLKASQYVTAHI